MILFKEKTVFENGKCNTVKVEYSIANFAEFVSLMRSMGLTENDIVREGEPHNEKYGSWIYTEDSRKFNDDLLKTIYDDFLGDRFTFAHKKIGVIYHKENCQKAFADFEKTRRC